MVVYLFPHKALYNYSAKFNDELSISEGCVLTLIRKVNVNWYQVMWACPYTIT